MRTLTINACPDTGRKKPGRTTAAGKTTLVVAVGGEIGLGRYSIHIKTQEKIINDLDDDVDDEKGVIIS
jgi:hypothetical protein